MEQECRRQFIVSMDLGLHLRPAAKLVRTAHQFQSEITVSDGGTTVSGKSILSLIILSAGHGAELTVTIRGADAEAAMEAVAELFHSGFGEECSEAQAEPTGAVAA